jgi:hypothetical protein
MSTKKALFAKPVLPPAVSAKDAFIQQDDPTPLRVLAPEPAVAAPSSDEKKKISVYITAEEYRRIKVWCAQNDRKLTELVSEAILSIVDQDKV